MVSVVEQIARGDGGDPWDLPFNGTVVSARRFVDALSDDVSFSIFMTPSDASTQAVLFNKLSIPGVNHIDRMQASVAKPNRGTLDEAMASLTCSTFNTLFPRLWRDSRG